MLVYCIIRNLLFIEKLTTSLKSCKFDIKKKKVQYMKLYQFLKKKVVLKNNQTKSTLCVITIQQTTDTLKF